MVFKAKATVCFLISYIEEYGQQCFCSEVKRHSWSQLHGEVSGPILNGHPLLRDVLQCFCVLPARTVSDADAWSKLRTSCINSYLEKQSSFPPNTPYTNTETCVRFL